MTPAATIAAAAVSPVRPSPIAQRLLVRIQQLQLWVSSCSAGWGQLCPVSAQQTAYLQDLHECESALGVQACKQQGRLGLQLRWLQAEQNASYAAVYGPQVSCAFQSHATGSPGSTSVVAPLPSTGACNCALRPGRLSQLVMNYSICLVLRCMLLLPKPPDSLAPAGDAVPAAASALWKPNRQINSGQAALY